MGVRVRVVVYADQATAVRSTRAAFTRIAELDAVLSDYRLDSEISRLADRAGERVRVTDDLFAVMTQALSLARESGGAFDPTVGPLTQLWRSARAAGEPPPADRLARALALVGWENVSLDSTARTIRLAEPGMRLDLGGIAKGYVLDRAIGVLRQAGVTRALVEAGGDIVVGDPPPGRTGWHIEIPGAAGEVARRATALAHAAVATSGDSEQFVEIDGVRYSHVVDPRTGLALTNGLSATVIAHHGAVADALATTATILGREAGLALIERFGAIGLVRHRDGATGAAPLRGRD